MAALDYTFRHGLKFRQQDYRTTSLETPKRVPSIRNFLATE